MKNILDCTLRDGGYYNDWNFPREVICEYLEAMEAAGINIVELGLRSLINEKFKGASAYTTDSYIETLNVPDSLKVAVMVNASELVTSGVTEQIMLKLFPRAADKSPVDIVRVACHFKEFESALPAAKWLKSKGYQVGFNIMQIADRDSKEIEDLAAKANGADIDVLYFADSMGSMSPAQCVNIINAMRVNWKGEIGIHAHDNMGMALQNTLKAAEHGVTWLDATVTGMGRGPGNTRTEELVISLNDIFDSNVQLVPLMALIKTYFQPLKNKCGWGSNPYYFLSGKHGIHPTFIQEMLSDPRFSEEDILSTIEQLKSRGAKSFSLYELNNTRIMSLDSSSEGTWDPEELIRDRCVLILGAGPSVASHATAVASFINSHNPVVIALNTASSLDEVLIDLRIASHPVRILADKNRYSKLPQPLIIPVGRLSSEVRESLGDRELYDFGLSVKDDEFSFGSTSAIVPSPLVLGYALAVSASGKAKKIFLAGFDGFGIGDKRTNEVQKIFNTFGAQSDIDLISITNTSYDIPSQSVYGLVE